MTLPIALADLDRLALAHPDLDRAAHTLAALLRIAFADPSPPPPPAPTDPLRVTWSAGLRALDAAPPPLDPRRLSALTLALAAILAADNPTGAPLHRAIANDPSLAPSWAANALHDPAALDRDLRRRSLDPIAVGSLLRLALIPDLAPWSAPFTPLLDGGAWTSPGCPACGDRPALAESRGLEARRFLRCARCAASWPTPRVGCPLCLTNDHRALSYRDADGRGDRHRLLDCSACGGRLKILSTLAPLSPPGLFVADLASIHLDLIDD